LAVAGPDPVTQLAGVQHSSDGGATQTKNIGDLLRQQPIPALESCFEFGAASGADFSGHASILS
jgi:hypothetical protein